jgi:hypothetical protein
MSHRIFSEEQQAELTKNVNVLSCTSKSITYHPDFKKKSLHAYLKEYRNAKEIFETESFNLDLIGKRTPGQCITRWKRDGIQGRSGRPKKKVFASLEAENAYLRAQNHFLLQLRAKRAEQNSGHKRNTC